jgi:hypothetical protein
LIINLQEAKTGGGHKRNKSESNMKNHMKKLSIDDLEMGAEKNHARKASKIVKKVD